jgi:NTE family protein
MTHSPQQSRTALVLGGGGSTGNAWLIGVVAGLFEAGVDVTRADLIVGTSAGATAAAQITGAAPLELLANILDAPAPARPAGAAPGRPPGSPVVNHMEKTAAIIGASSGLADMRRKLGAAALEVDAESDSEWTAQWRATVGPRLPRQDWPQQRLVLTAVDARTGEGIGFDRESGVALVDAVAASTAGGPNAYRIGDGRYIDGGYRTNAENADLATGFERVLVLSPFGGRSRMPAEWGTHLATQVDTLRAQGSAVESIFPEAEFEHLFGPNGMNLSLRPAAARAGHDQGKARAAQLAEFWQ